MKAAMCCICFLLCIYPFGSYGMNWKNMKYPMDREPAACAVTDTEENDKGEEPEQSGLTRMEALDLVKEQYCSNFDKIQPPGEDNYYYQLSVAEYYLVYEGLGETEEEYLFRLYEFVLDEPEEGIGHTVTYGWYWVNRLNGEVTVFP